MTKAYFTIVFFSSVFISFLLFQTLTLLMRQLTTRLNIFRLISPSVRPSVYLVSFNGLKKNREASGARLSSKVNLFHNKKNNFIIIKIDIIILSVCVLFLCAEIIVVIEWEEEWPADYGHQ